MVIDFNAEVEKRKEDLLKDLQEFIRIPSELIEQPENMEAPFGDAVRESLDFILEKGAQAGMRVKNVENIAGHVEFGEGDEYVGILGHTDVVPAGNDWSFEPYGAKIEDGFIYGRGTQDDKGPTIAAFYGMKIVKELGLELSKRVRLIVGTDEESKWRCLPRYFELEERPALGFVPDADFPLIYGEKGIWVLEITGESEKNGLLSFKSGLRNNMVPDFAEVTLVSDLSEKFAAYCEKKDIKYTINEGVLRLSGKSVHGAEPYKGINAAFLMLNFLKEVGITNPFTEFMHEYLVDDVYGEKFGIAFEDEEMGKLTVNTGIVNFEEGKVHVVLNPRHPNHFDTDGAMKKITEAVSSYGLAVEKTKDTPLMYVNPESELVKTLHSIYIEHTDDTESKLLTIGGGTYSRLTPNVVAFGAFFPGREDRMHQLDERTPVEDLFKAAVIYAHAIYELAK